MRYCVSARCYAGRTKRAGEDLAQGVFPFGDLTDNNRSSTEIVVEVMGLSEIDTPKPSF